MILVKLLVCLISMFYLAESAVCPQEDSCQHNYGKRLTPQIQSQATFIAYTKVTEQTGSFDPIPCCKNCYAQAGCNYYILDFNSGNCSLFSLPSTNTFVVELAIGRYYQKIPTVENTCIGFANTYLFANM